MLPVEEFSELDGHGRIDARSLAMYRAIAEKLRQSPELLAIAHDNLERWAVTAGRAQPYLDAWGELLKLPLEELLAVMLEDGERMTAMRQAGPFAGVLSLKERWELDDRFATRASDPGGLEHSG